MAEISINQKVNNYLASHKELKGKSDEFILSLMAKDGVITQSEIDKLKSSSTFGFGHKTDNDFLGLKIEQITKTNEPVYRTPLREPEHSIYRKLSSDEAMAVDMLQKTVNEAATTLENRDKEGGVVSHYVVNKWYELFNDELKKSNVKAELNTLKKDIATLKLDNPNFTFSESFKISRGVDYSIMNLTDCKSKSEKYIQIKTATQMIKHTKTLLLDSTKGDVESQLNPEKSSEAIIQALQLCNKGSDKDIKDFLDNFSESTKDNPIMKKYGGKLQVFKNKKGEPVIYRETPNGREPATAEQLNLIARTLAKNLDKTFLMSMGVEVAPNATAKELAQKTQDIYDNAQREYQEAFSKAFGGKDAAILAEEYAAKEAQGVAYIEMGVNMLSMAAMLLPGVNVGVTGWLANTTKATKVAQATAKIAQGAVAVQRGTQAISPLLMANVTLNPIELLEQLSSENGMSKEEWQEWGKSVVENGLYMALGMGASRGAEELAAMYKTRTLVTTLKNAGKTADEISAMIKSNPLKFPDEIINSMKKVDRMAKALQISTESALDLSTTYLANQALNNGDLTSIDWIMSIGTAMMGGAIQKQFARLTTEQKVKRIHEAFKEYGATELDAKKILQTMDDISSGKIDANAKSQVLDEVEIKANDTQIKTEKTSVDNKTSVNEAEIKITENPPATPAKARKILLDIGFTEKELESVDFNNPQLLTRIEGVNYVIKTNLVEFDINNKDYKREILDIFSDNRRKYDGINFLNKENVELLKKHNIADDDIIDTLLNSNGTIASKIKIHDLLESDNRFDGTAKKNIFGSTTQHNLQARKLIYDTISKDERFSANEIIQIMHATNEENIKLAKIICTDKEFPKDQISSILNEANKDNLEFAEQLCYDKEFPKIEIGLVLPKTNNDNLTLAKKLCFDKDFPKNIICAILCYANKDNLTLAEKLCFDKEFPKDEIVSILNGTNKDNLEFAEQLCFDKEFPKEKIGGILSGTNKDNLEFAEQLCYDKEFPKKQIGFVLSKTNNDNLTLAKKLCFDKDFQKNIIGTILCCANKDNLTLAEKLCFDKEFPKDQISSILNEANKDNLEFAEQLCYDKEFPKDKIVSILNGTNKDNLALAKKLCYYKEFPLDCIPYILQNYTECSVQNIETFKKQYKKIMQNPESYINGELKEYTIRQLNYKINSFSGEIMKLADALDKEALDTLFRKRIDSAEEYFRTVSHFSKEEIEILKEINNACNIDGKPFMPTQKVDMIELIEGYKNCGLDTSKLSPVDGKFDLGQAKIDLFNNIMKKIGYTDAEIAAIPKEKLILWDTTYAHKLAQEVRDSKSLQDLIHAANLDDFNRYIHDITNKYGQTNAKTKAEFETIKMNYDAWLHPSKDSEIIFKSMDKNQEQLLQISQQLIEDINTLRQNPGVKGFIDKQFPKCIKEGDFVVPNEFLTSKEKLTEFTNNVLKQLENVWKRAEGNATGENADRAAKARNTLTIRDHLNQRLDDISKVQNAESRKSLDITIKMWDRIPQKDIFQGNYSTCCIGMGSGNGEAMPHYLLDTAYNMIELVDNNTGKTIGNALCYFVKGQDGKPKFIVDNIEINNSAKPSSNVQLKLRQQIANYADNVAREVTGRTDTEIYMSSYYNDVVTNDLKSHNESVALIGDTDCDEIYMDLFGGWENKENGIYKSTCNLLKLEPEPKPEPKTEAETIYKINKLKTLERYKNKTNEQLEKIAVQYDVENIDALVELGNLPQVKDGIFEIKIPDAYDITGEEVIQTKDGIVRKSIKVLKPEVEEQLWNIAKRLRARGLRNEKAIANFMKKNNLTPEGYIIEHRVKSLQSLYDKLKNFVLDDKNNDKTMFEALNDVRDAVGMRTIIPQKDYAHTPEVQALIAQGKKQEAVALAMQMQSQEIVTNFEKLIDKLMHEGFEDLGVVRFSNYKGDNGMPYVDQEKIGEIKLKIDVGLDDITPERAQLELKHGIGLQTKDFETQTRKSGYTAFQVNFKTKKGYIYEWQFRGEKVNEFAEAEHIPYDLRTEKDITSANPNAKKIYEPIKEILSPQNMLNEDYNEYNQYLTKYYEYCRMIELGFTDEKPPEFNYKKFDKRLKGENLITLHLYADKMKKAKPSELEALAKEYESKLIN